MRKLIFSLTFLALVLVGLTTMAWKDDGGPTTPTLPNKFEITGIEDYGTMGFGSFSVTIFYANNTDSDAPVSGKVYFGDGTSMEVSATTSAPGGYPLYAKTTKSTEIGRFNHDYAAAGTYRVKAEFTANFKNGAISKTFEKDFAIAGR